MARTHLSAALVATSIGILCWLAIPLTMATASDTDGYVSEIESWHRQRVENLIAEDGWVTLIGLFWLEPGANSMGSDPSSDIQLPADKAPAQAAILLFETDRIEIETIADTPITHQGQAVRSMVLAPDTGGEPTVLDLGDLQFFVIERDGRYGVRVRDRAHPDRFTFAGIDRFPVDPRWRITGRLERHEPPATIPVPNVLGTLNELPSPGTVVFEIDGQTSRIAALEASRGRLYLIFADGTSGRETYGGGRFLYSEPVQEDGSVVVDFNKAYNPPCAFTDFATCPLPPRQNKLAVRIEAGEKSYGKH